jgi:hypothetical protein
VTSSRMSSSNFDISEQDITERTAGVCLLAPKITVTPECRALDGGATRL